MTHKLLLLGLLVSVLSAAQTTTRPQDGQVATPLPRAIPGITAKDAFPRGCVDCHINYPDIKLDTRISTLMKQWTVKVEPGLLRKAAAAAPPGLTLKGKHPIVPSALRDIPGRCLMCHSRASKTAPPFSRLLHAVHLTGGAENHFLTVFQGECTHCHKLNTATGAWSLPSGSEK